MLPISRHDAADPEAARRPTSIAARRRTTETPSGASRRRPRRAQGAAVDAACGSTPQKRKSSRCGTTSRGRHRSPVPGCSRSQAARAHARRSAGFHVLDHLDPEEVRQSDHDPDTSAHGPAPSLLIPEHRQPVAGDQDSPRPCDDDQVTQHQIKPPGSIATKRKIARANTITPATARSGTRPARAQADACTQAPSRDAARA